MTVTELRLFAVFNHLLRQNWVLTIDDFRLVLHAWQVVPRLTKYEDLKQLCRSLWVKSKDDLVIFDNAFDRIMLEPFRIEERPPIRPPDSDKEDQEKDRGSDRDDKQSPARRRIPEISMPDSKEDYTVNYSEEAQPRRAVKAMRLYTRETEYLPLSHHKLKQIWHNHGNFVGWEEAELDLEATVNQIGRQDFFLEPVTQMNQPQRVELLLLVDWNGSMMPFHLPAQQLMRIIGTTRQLRKIYTYYFHNCPDIWLYRDKTLRQARSKHKVLNSLDHKYTVSLIFSDAGAALGGIDWRRVSKTKRFLSQLTRRVHRVAWLNPMPRSRWLGTSATYIADFVPMFEFSGQDSMKRMVRALDGYSQPAERGI